LKYTPKIHPDYHNTKKALKLIKVIAGKLNDERASQENRAEIMRIQNALKHHALAWVKELYFLTAFLNVFRVLLNLIVCYEQREV